ncbi:DUF6716 putative glycosyltransferase [Demequina oxidasica]|uniref:DUF6716 putative glycosyltransferase n=1 Tax=Demequina oxidasica TaxID=676199 RepID=UPI00078257C3|nr:DUF6716 putative glycosyltransferase [Demequina oxidasica]
MPLRLLIVADSDSYLKWAVSRAVDLPRDVDARVVVVENAVTPSELQVKEAVNGRWPTPPSVSARHVVRQMRAGKYDAVLLACRGPLIDLLCRRALEGLVKPPVIVVGIPGIWYPPTQLGVQWRAHADVYVVHSKRERAALKDLVGPGAGIDVGLASLDRPLEVHGADPEGSVIFAPQALVPRTKVERVELLRGIALAARSHPSVSFVIKLRGNLGEAQTHAEVNAFQDLAQTTPVELPPNVSFERGSLATHLSSCRGFLTVSSTGAIEAVAVGVPALMLTDFGVDAANINEVFADSGMTGTLDNLARLEFRLPHPEWSADNYFHPEVDNDWFDVVRERAASSRRTILEGASIPSYTRTARLRQRAVALGSADSKPVRLSMAFAAAALKWRRRAVRLVSRRMAKRSAEGDRGA